MEPVDVGEASKVCTQNVTDGEEKKLHEAWALDKL